MALNKKYSYKSWKRQSFTGKDPKEFNDSEIVGACFCQNEPFTDVFPPTMTGVTFERCNMDNCNIPEGNTIKAGTHKQLKEQNDGEFWLVDKDLKPIEPLNKAEYEKQGLSILPKDIPLVKDDEPITMKQERIKQEKIEALKADDADLERILKDRGEL